MAEENNGSWPNQQTPQSSEQPHNEQQPSRLTAACITA